MSPTVPLYGQPKVEERPIAGVKQTNVPGPDAFGAQLGETAAGIGIRGATAIADQARQQAHEVSLLDFDRQGAAWEETNVHNPQTGVLNTVKGKDAYGLPQSVGDAYDKFTGDLIAKLHPDVQLAAQKLAQHRRVDIMGTLDSYASKQGDLYENAVTKDWLDKSVGLAIAKAGAGDVAGVAAELEKQPLIIDGFAQHTHLPAELREGMVDDWRTKTHVGVVDELLAQGRDQDAQAYFDAAKDQINGAHLPALEARLQTGSSEGAGLRASEAIWQQLGPKGESDPISLDRMEDAARSQFADNPRALKATISYLRERKAGVDASRNAREDAIAGNLWQAAAAGAPLSQLRTMPEYLEAPGRVQAQLSDYIVNKAERVASRAAADESRAYTREQRAEHEKERNGYSLFWGYNQPANLAQMSDNEVNALRGTLGDELTNRLMANKRAWASEGAAKAATIDDATFKSIAQDAGLNPYKSRATQTKDEQAALGRLKADTEQAIDVEQRARGNKVLSLDEKTQVMQRIVDQHVKVEGWFSDADRVAASVVKPSDRENAYVPVAQIPQVNIDEYTNYLRSVMPRLQRASATDIATQYRARIQRAYAAQLLKLGDAEVMRRLEGR